MCPQTRLEDSRPVATNIPHPAPFGDFVVHQAVAQAIERIVNALVHVVDLRDDLRQEALAHFWVSVSRFPEKTFSWHFKACSMHVRDMLKRGTSLDSAKRARSRCDIDLASQSAELEGSVELTACEDVFLEASARDMLGLLGTRLKPPDHTILLLLNSGCHVCEIAKKLRMPHWEISRSRSRIAEAASDLGIRPTGWI